MWQLGQQGAKEAPVLNEMSIVDGGSKESIGAQSDKFVTDFSVPKNHKIASFALEGTLFGKWDTPAFTTAPRQKLQAF